MLVKMSHPKLPGREIEVQEISVPHHERAGWRRVKPARPRRNETPERQESSEGEQS